MFYDKSEERFYVSETAYELQKYYVIEVAENKTVVHITQFTTIALNVGTASTGRGQRSIEIDAKEFIALRNIVHFNSHNPFKSPKIQV